MFQAKSTVYLPGYIRECHKVSFDLWKICLSCPLSIALSLTLHIQTEILCSFRGVPRIYNIMALPPSLSPISTPLCITEGSISDSPCCEHRRTSECPSNLLASPDNIRILTEPLNKVLSICRIYFSDIWPKPELLSYHQPYP